MTNIKLLNQAKETLSIEASSIQDLKNSLGEDFLKAIDIIYNMEGRLIVTGIGKSGHIARKISATLASTGTPSFFIHPSEASHGDLGMITKDDVVLMLSNSGKTEELYNTINYCKRFDIPIIAITANKESTLSKSSKVLLLLPKFQEACPLGLAPTTSTTMQLALGDALATTLLKKRGFSSGNFGTFHPGGSLGSRLLRVEDIMHKEVPSVSTEATMNDAVVVMTEGALGAIAITDNDNNLIGAFTDGDLRRHINDENLLKKPIKDIMSKQPINAPKDMLISEALNILNSKNISALFVVGQNNKLEGILHIHDCLRAGVC